ncbi:MAG: hypothetical protein A2046_03320 [Bacteroidetes bacterium GWA2_30_7]|nr:MAG: hypothetical protein A2046_03320 [Bacteroidetes bacterium GWA2_30_7]
MFFVNTGFSQTPKTLDSLFSVLKNAKEDTAKAQLLLKIGNLFEKNSSDSAIYFYHQSIDISKKLKLNEATKLLYANALTALSLVYVNYKRQFDSSFVNAEKAITIYKTLINSNDKHVVIESKLGISNCYYSFGHMYDQQGIYDLALTNYKKTLNLNEELGEKKSMFTIFTKIGVVNWYQGNFEQAIQNLLKALKIAEENSDKKSMAICYINIGNVHYNQKSYDYAIENYLKASKIFDDIKDKRGISISYNNIGAIYSDQKDYEKAIIYFQKSLKIKEELNDKKGISACYINIGVIFKEKRNFNSALEYYKKSLIIEEELGNKTGIISAWNSLSDAYFIIADSINYNKLEKYNYYKESIKYAENSFRLANEINSLSLKLKSVDILYRAYKKIGQTVKALEYTEIFIATNDSMFTEEKTKAIAEMESKYQNEKKQKEIELLEKDKVLQTEEIAKQTLLRNSFIIGFLLIFSLAFIILISYRQKRKANKLLLLKNFEIEQKKEEIQSQANLLQATNNELEKLSVIARETDNSVIIADSSGHIEWVNEGFTKLFGYKLEEFIAEKGDNLRKATSNSNFETYFQNMISEKKSVNYISNTVNKFDNEIWVQTYLWPILDQLDEISKIVIIETDITKIKNAEEKATELYKIAEYQKLQITDSINYSKIIQSSILPSISEIKKSFPEIFIIYKPKDVVSGDFYYYAELGDYKIIATVDCTGHGVPGAFMSMIGYDILNHIIFVQGIVRPAEILTRLHKGIRFAFSKENNIVNNGMDLSICSINPDKKELLYAGAFNEIYIVNEKNNSPVLNLCEKFIENNKFILSELLSDKISIGGDYEDVKFTEKKLTFSENDTIYMFSDGFVDQFGGKKKRKYMSKRLKEFLLNIQDIDMESQEFALNNEFESWKGNEEQTDDVLLVGIKFTSKDESFKLELSAEDILYIQPFLIELQNITIYNTGKVLNVLKSIVNESETLKKWKEAVEKAIYVFNEAEYKRLIEIENKNIS